MGNTPGLSGMMIDTGQRQAHSKACGEKVNPAKANNKQELVLTLFPAHRTQRKKIREGRRERMYACQAWRSAKNRRLAKATGRDSVKTMSSLVRNHDDGQLRGTNLPLADDTALPLHHRNALPPKRRSPPGQGVRIDLLRQSACCNTGGVFLVGGVFRVVFLRGWHNASR